MNAYKYKNTPTLLDGVVFASKLEARRYGELRLLEWAGQISNLKTQVPFQLVVNGQLVATYTADFTYTDSQGKQHIEDAKGMLTPVYRLKKKLMRACYGIDIEEYRA